MKLTDLTSRLRGIKAIRTEAIVESTAQEVSLDFGRRQLATSGAAGGAPWAGYSGEPMYAAYKMAITGALEPLKWKGSTDGLEDALVNKSSRHRRWSRRGDRYTLDITLPYIEQLEKGGVGPFGERFPARFIFPRRGALTRQAVATAKDKFMVEVGRAGFKVTRK